MVESHDPLKKITRTLLFLLFLPASNNILASGNHPEAGFCSADKPYYAICTHSLHNLEGWFGNECHTDKASAERDATIHAEKYHQGNMRWTGIKQPR